MELATEFAIRTKLDVDTLIKTEPNQIQRLLNCAFLFARHSRYLWVELLSLIRFLGCVAKVL